MTKDWVVFRPEPQGGFSVEVTIIPECRSYGRTLEEAVRNIKEKINEYLDSLELEEE